MAANQTVNVYGKIPPRYIKQAPTSKKAGGVWFGFPLGSAPDGGFFSKKSGVEMIKDAVKQLLRTERGGKRLCFQILDAT